MQRYKSALSDSQGEPCDSGAFGELDVMVTKKVLNRIAADERLTRGLHDPEARILVEWLVARAEQWADQGMPADSLVMAVEQLCHRARAIALFVRLWCHQQLHGAAGQLAAVERFAWPLPAVNVDPCELMLAVLASEAGCSILGSRFISGTSAQGAQGGL